MEDRTVPTEEARDHLRDVLDEVAGGAHITVARYRKPAAVIVPLDWYEAAKLAIAEGLAR